MSMVCMIPEAKNLKLRATRGISTALASHTGFPWSRDSASANWSNRDSTASAILLSRRDRSRGGVLDHLEVKIVVMYMWGPNTVQ